MTDAPLGRVEPLPAGIDILPDTDVDSLWEPFRFYEAGHHRMTIMNPLSGAGLDRLVDALVVANGERVLDIACGHGDLLLRVTAGHDVTAAGVDLSPWTIRRARARLDQAGGAVALTLGDGRRYLEARPTTRWDVIALIGAPWIWGGFGPSVDALTAHLNPGGRLAIGDIVATDAEARRRLDPLYDDPGTAADHRQALERAGLVDLIEMPSEAADWRAYDDRVLDGLQHWLEVFPGDGDYLERQRDYERRRADDADVSWQVWIGRLPA